MLLRAHHAQHLVSLPLVELRTRVLDAAPLDDHDVELLDHVLQTRLLDAVRELGDPAAVREVHAALVRAVPPSVRRALPERWQARWRGFTDLLDTRLGQLRQQDPAAVRRRRHVRPFLDAVQVAPKTQQELAELLGVSKATVSRLASVLEDHDLIRRERVGRENLVTATTRPRTERLMTAMLA